MTAEGGMGMGSAAALLFARGGARVLCVDIDGEGAERVASQIVEEGGHAVGIAADMGDLDATAAVAGSALDAFGGVDIVANVAAALGPDVLGRDIDIVSLD